MAIHNRTFRTMALAVLLMTVAAAIWSARSAEAIIVIDDGDAPIR